MGKHETPPFHMVIEGGRLVPSTPFDAERLDSYRRGTKVRVHFTEEKDRPLVRKWWAVLGLVVKQCDVPWQNKEQASEAIKLALGIVNLTRTVRGAWMQYPRSLTELTDPELDDAVRDMLDLIHNMTGVDPETLKKEAADVGGDTDQDSSGEPHPSDDGSGNSSLSPEEPAADNSAQQSGPEAGASTEDALSLDDEGQHSAETAPASESIDGRVINLMEECRDKFLQLAIDENLTREQRWGRAEKTKDIWKEALTENRPFVKACFEAAGRVVKIGPALEADERAMLDKMIDEVRP